MNVFRRMGIVCICIMLCCSCTLAEKEKVKTEDLDPLQMWLWKEYENYIGSESVAFLVPYSKDICWLELNGTAKQGASFIRMMGHNIIVDGRKDAGRKYYEGCVEGCGGNLCIVDFETLEYVLYEENMKSVTIGDYYVHFDSYENIDKIDLLIFYCPI